MEVNGQVEQKQYNLFDQKHVIKFKRYKAESKEEYEKRLYALSTWQLSEEAVRLDLGGKFSNNRRLLIQKLVRQYVQDKGKYDIIVGNTKVDQIPQENQDNLREMFAFMNR
jgi:hypothetical protein